ESSAVATGLDHSTTRSGVKTPGFPRNRISKMHHHLAPRKGSVLPANGMVSLAGSIQFEQLTVPSGQLRVSLRHRRIDRSFSGLDRVRETTHLSIGRSQSSDTNGFAKIRK